MNEMIVFCR
ncbi:hypothetical protein BDFB_008608 [Asbolus verrucosus]|uniref:Uncharacterized protein n=1 Tax=Asbolus verrucosus TaxID=1661398 RepID=A0A482VU74_ASBVE|nr:hypothetical protein BDFB_008608 [Asbolus verrucosus]